MLEVEFKFTYFYATESSGFAEIVVIISGGSSAMPITVRVIIKGRSATGKGVNS